MIGIRCDGNIQIGIGHVMRCISIALELRKMKDEVIFICADYQASSIISQHGFRIVTTQSNWNQLDNETLNIIALIKFYAIKCLLVDSYYVSEKYLKTLKKSCKVFYMDDVYAFDYPVDGIINYNISHYMFDYAQQKEKHESEPIYLLGPEYAPLREEFQNVSKIQIKREVKHVFVSTGGADNYRICNTLLNNMIETQRYKELKFHVVIGKYFQDENIVELKRISQSIRNIRLYENVLSMSQIMKQCDLAITAGGSTIMELCALGIPFITFSFVDNQDSIVKACDEKQIGLFAGRLQGEDTSVLCENIIGNLSQMMAYKTRLFFARNASMITDGKGALRIAKVLMDVT